MDLADFVKNVSEQLQQVQSQLAHQQEFNLQYQTTIDDLTTRLGRQQNVNDVLTEKVFRLESQWRASECFNNDGNVNFSTRSTQTMSHQRQLI